MPQYVPIWVPVPLQLIDVALTPGRSFTDASKMMQDTIDALMRAPDVMKSLREVLRKIKDVPKLLQRLQVSTVCMLVDIIYLRTLVCM